MKRITHKSEWNTLLVKYFKYVPKARMENRISSCYIEIRLSVHLFAHLSASIYRSEATFPAHLHQLRMPFAEDITMFATLIAHVGDMPLKSKIFHSFD
jgi:hypothetical protein